MTCIFSAEKTGSTGRVIIRGDLIAIGGANKAFKGAYFPLLERNDITEIALDMKDVLLIDSSGIGMLLMLRERASVAGGKRVYIEKISAEIGLILEVFHLKSIFGMEQK